MDTKTLIIAALVAALATTLSMAVVFWTRRTYPGFGYWVAGAGCRVLAGVLFLLPRDQFPPWLTIVLSNYLLFAEAILYLRGTLVFRDRPVRKRWDLSASLVLIVLLAWFTYGSPILNARVAVVSLALAAWALWLARVLLSRRPPYSGSFDRAQAGVWMLLAVVDIARALYAVGVAPPIIDPLDGSLFQSQWLLLLILVSLLVALSQIVMNAQRLEYDLGLAQEQLKQYISERQQAEAQLRISEERHRLLAENARDVIWTMEGDGRISYISPSVEQLRGFTPAEAMVQTLEEIHPPESQAVSRAYFGDLLARVQAGIPPDTFRGELEYRCKDGSTIWTDVLACPMLGPDGRLVQLLGVSRDITERKRYELGLREARDAAEAANLAKSTFLAHMSHELRTPMNGIIGMSELALRTALDDQQRGYVQKIATSARSLLGILNDILDFSKIEAEKLELDHTGFDLRQLVDRVMHLLEVAAQDKGLALCVDYAPDLDRYFIGDSLRIMQVLTNLLGNAIKFTSSGTIRLGIGQPGAGRLRFEVCDTGIGLTPEQQERLFQSFSQADSSTTRRFGGTGLGLAISKRLVELMEGRIAVRSEPGLGSTFSFEIEAPPWLDPDPALIESNTGAVRTEPGGDPPRLTGLAGRRLLLVEDNAINRDIVQGFLADSGLVIAVAEDGRQAVDRCRDGRWDLILMDVQMPVMDGIEATRRIRTLDPEVPIIALTANAYREDIDRTRAAGMNDHLNKPIAAQTLYAAIRKHLRPRSGPESSREPAHEPGQEPGPTPAVTGAAQPPTSPAPGDRGAEPSHLDMAVGLALMGGDEALYRRVLHSFATDCGDLRVGLGDRESALRLHTLKGLSAQIGATRLQRLAAALEGTGNAALIPACNEELAAVLAEIRQLTGSIRCN